MEQILQISTNGGKEWATVTCSDESNIMWNHHPSKAFKETMKYTGRNEDGFAVFKLSNGFEILTDYDESFVEGQEYEYKFSAE